MSRTSLLRMAAALSAMATAVALAAPTPEQLARLGNELTPVGAERAGNAAGTIPPWTGGLPAKPIACSASATLTPSRSRASRACASGKALA